MDRPAHQWDTSIKKTLDIEEFDDRASGYIPQIILDARETERYVEELQKFDIKEVGSKLWMQQHKRLVKLNQQAHENAMSNSDEYVLEAILTFDKIEILIHDLLLIEIWKESVYPLLLEELAGKNSMRVFFILYHEGTLINLLELFFYHKHLCEAGGEKVLEMVDYVARKLARLNNPNYDFRVEEIESKNNIDKDSAKEFAANLEARSPVDELKDHFAEIDFRVCTSAVSICRFICEHADALPLSVVSRITDTHDLLIVLVPLIENPPWTRRNPKTGKWMKVIDHKWTEVKPIDLLKITKLEGQPWLSIYHLCAKEVFSTKYHFNSFRKGQLLRVRKYLNEILLDQLPFLADIQRYMDELSMTEVPEPRSIDGGAGVFTMFQQVAVIRDSILRSGTDGWEGVKKHQLTAVFTMTDRTDTDLMEMADLYSIGMTAEDAVEELS